jgi:hypothetical protein
VRDCERRADALRTDVQEGAAMIALLDVAPGPGWTELRSPSLWSRIFRRRDGFLVIVSNEPHDGASWRHVSCSYPRRLPSWEDVRTVKRVFIGEDEDAMHRVPPKSEHVNVHDYCLHLWAREGVRLMPLSAMATVGGGVVRT